MNYPLHIEGFERRNVALQVSFWGKTRILVDGKIIQPANRTFLLRDDSNRIVPLRLKRGLFDPVPTILYRNMSLEVVLPFRWYAYIWICVPLVLFPAIGILKIPFEGAFIPVFVVCLASALAGSYLAGLLLRTNMPTFIRYTTGGMTYGILMTGTLLFYFLVSTAVFRETRRESMARYVELGKRSSRSEIHRGDHAPTLLHLLPANTVYDAAGYPLVGINYANLRFLLRTQKYGELNDTLHFYQRLFEADFRAEDLVAHAYQTFAVDDTLFIYYLNDWVRKTPDKYQAYLARGVYRERRGWESRGYRWAHETPDSSFRLMEWYFEQAEDDFFKALELEPQALYSIETLIDIGRARGADDAIKILMIEGLKVCPYALRIRQAYMRGLTPRWGGTYASMESFASEADKFAAVNPRLRGLHGYVYSDMASLSAIDTNDTQAIQLYTKALSLGAYPEFYEERGNAYWSSHNYAAAFEDFSSALSRSPGNPHLLILKAKMLYFLNRLPESSALLDSAGLLDPEYEKSIVEWKGYAADLLVVAGYPYYRANRDEEAIVYYNRALVYYPGSAQAYYYRGMAMIHLNRFDEALRDMKTAIQCNPHHFESYRMIDWLLAHNGNWEQIIGYWDNFIALEPTNARAYLERSGTYFHLGNIAAARRDAEKACDLGSDEGCRIVQRLKAQ